MLRFRTDVDVPSVSGLREKGACLPSKGVLQDRGAFHPSGRVLMVVRDVETGEVIHTVESNNTIVYNADLLAAEILKGDGVPAITHLAVGIGLGAWVPTSPPSPTKDQTQLENEIFRGEVTSTWVDPATGEPMSPQQVLDGDGVNTQRTFLVDFSITLGADDANGDLMEMGLFGGTAADTTNKGTMINYYTFRAWPKTSNQAIQIVWRISFRHTDYIPEYGTCAVLCQTACELGCETTCQVDCQTACELTAQ